MRKFLIVIVPIVIFAEWQIQIVDTHGGAGASLALDSEGNPYISYGDSDNNILKFARWTGALWEIDVVDTIGSFVYPVSSIALGSTNVPHIAYYFEPGGDLRYGFRSNSTWVIEIVDTNGITGFAPSLYLDNEIHPHIAYFLFDLLDLKYAYRQNNNWIVEVVDTGTVYGVTSSSLCIDNIGHPHIVVAKWVGAWARLIYLKKVNFDWNAVIFDSSEYVRPPGGAIALDSLSYPHIVYSVAHSFVKYAYWNGIDWMIEVVDAIPRQVNGIDITLDSRDVPHIAYSIDEMGIWYAYKTPGGIWHREQVINGIFGQVSLALDSADTPHIAFHDNRTFYARRSQTRIEHKQSFPQPDCLMAYPNPVSQILCIRFCGMHDGFKTLKIFDVSGRVVRDLSALLFGSADAINWDLCDKHGRRVEPGVYFLLARFGTIDINKKIIVVR